MASNKIARTDRGRKASVRLNLPPVLLSIRRPRFKVHDHPFVILLIRQVYIAFDDLPLCIFVYEWILLVHSP